MTSESDLIIIGGGIVGLATAYRFLERFPGKTVTVLEKEASVAKHQTGRNSGVMHTGIYYRPGSLKATQLPRRQEGDGGVLHEGEHSVRPVRQDHRRGRRIGAAADGDAAGARAAERRGLQSDHARADSRARALLRRPRRDSCSRGGRRRLRPSLPSGWPRSWANGEAASSRCAKATGIRRDAGRAVVETAAGEFAAKQIVNCAGLYSDRVTRLSGAKPSAKVVPFRGEFYALRPEGQYLVKGLIYPVPDPAYPFLGVHFTKRMSGMIECGPNAVLAFAREGYKNTTVNLRDLGETLTYPGFWRLATRYWRIGANEMHRSFSKRAFVRRCSGWCLRSSRSISTGPRPACGHKR